MTIDSLNPGDTIRVNDDECDVFSHLKPLKGKNIPIHHVKLNDSFPNPVIVWEWNGGIRHSYPISPSRCKLVNHEKFSRHRWIWIAKRMSIGDCYSLYNSPITKDRRYQYLWQLFDEEHKYYCCPFCGKRLNKQSAIEDVSSNDKEEYKVKECNCKNWKKREEDYNEILNLESKIKSLENRILSTVSFDDFIFKEYDIP